ncbi:hypothetical protein ACHAXS_000460 [Conticribra weissflogii]
MIQSFLTNKLLKGLHDASLGQKKKGSHVGQTLQEDLNALQMLTLQEDVIEAIQTTQKTSCLALDT